MKTPAQLFNTIFVIGSNGEIIGKHSKIKALRGAEGWSTAGKVIEPVDCNGVKVGILVCADAYKNEVAQVLKDKGAELYVSPVSWGPGQCAPDGEWEQRSLDNHIPIIVCKPFRGLKTKNWTTAGRKAFVAREGRRLLEATSECSVILTFDWDLDEMCSLSEDFSRIWL